MRKIEHAEIHFHPEVPGRSGLSEAWLSSIVFGVALVCALVVTLVPEYIEGRRLVRDDWDRDIYMKRSAFVVQPDAKPYKDVESEYPQLATYLFTAPYTFQFLHPIDHKTYMDTFTFLMAFALFGFSLVWLYTARGFGVNKNWVLALLLPGTLYFTLNRYDIVPALLVLGALVFLIRRRPVIAYAILAIAVLTKAYPLLFVPLFTIVTYKQGGFRRACIGVAVFIGVILAFSAQLALWSGVDAIFAPYSFQLGRDLNEESIYYLIANLFPAATPVLKPAFLLLQAALAVAVVFKRPKSDRAILRWVIAITLAFIIGNRFQSPQWVIWITPIALIASLGRIELALVVLQDVLAYIYFPIVYDSPLTPWLLPMTICILAVVRIALIVLMLQQPEHLVKSVNPASQQPAIEVAQAIEG